MTEMSADEAIDRYGPSELTRDDFLIVDDENFRAETAALVNGAANGIGRANALALATNGLTVLSADVDEERL